MIRKPFSKALLFATFLASNIASGPVNAEPAICTASAPQEAPGFDYALVVYRSATLLHVFRFCEQSTDQIQHLITEAFERTECGVSSDLGQKFSSISAPDARPPRRLLNAFERLDAQPFTKVLVCDRMARLPVTADLDVSETIDDFVGTISKIGIWIQNPFRCDHQCPLPNVPDMMPNLDERRAAL